MRTTAIISITFLEKERLYRLLLLLQGVIQLHVGLVQGHMAHWLEFVRLIRCLERAIRHCAAHVRVAFLSQIGQERILDKFTEVVLVKFNLLGVSEDVFC